MSVDSDVRNIAALLEDEYAHAILVHTNDREMSAPELSDACDASVSAETGDRSVGAEEST